MDIKGRWALVTGASRGIGKLIALELAKSGCNLILHSRNVTGTKDLLEMIKGMGNECYSVAAELSKIEDVERLISEVKRLTCDNLDILYNNAAIMTEYRPLFEPTVKEYQDSFMVNTIAPAKLCDAFIPSMLKNNWGRIINVTSGIENVPSLMPYSCSKAALDRYVRDMIPTLEGTNVLMNLMDPGWLKTDLGGPDAPNSPESVIPAAIVPVLLKQESGSGHLYKAQEL